MVIPGFGEGHSVKMISIYLKLDPITAFSVYHPICDDIQVHILTGLQGNNHAI